MTKSAKQDTKEGPAETAETASAATTRCRRDRVGRRRRPRRRRSRLAADDATGDGKPDLDEVKAKFREALDRKHQVHDEGQGKGGHEAARSAAPTARPPAAATSAARAADRLSGHIHWSERRV